MTAPDGYAVKFKEFIALCKNTKPGGKILIADPHALGDTYEELIESLSLLGDAEAHLVLVPLASRKAARRNRHA